MRSERRDRSGSETDRGTLERYTAAVIEAGLAVGAATVEAWARVWQTASRSYRYAMTTTAARHREQRATTADRREPREAEHEQGHVAEERAGAPVAGEEPADAPRDNGEAEPGTPGSGSEAAADTTAVTLGDVTYAIAAGANSDTYTVTAGDGTPVGAVHRRRSASGKSVTWAARTMDDLPIGTRAHSSRIKAATAVAEHHRDPGQ
jgi:hypothetical protein